MKNLKLIIAALILNSTFLIFNCAAQTFPYGINYQAVARDANGNAKANTNVGVRFTIAPTTATNTPTYIETQTATTNVMGQFNAIIGVGTYVSGTATTFSAIGWQGNTYNLKVEILNGASYVVIGSQPLMAVPYAMATPNDVPAGSVMAFFGTTAPAGWLLCDGSAVNRQTYAKLYAVIGNASGYGDNSSTFNLPDLRGQFLRGLDGTAGNDPDKATRTAQNSGGNTGNNVGSYETDAFQGHLHWKNQDHITELDDVNPTAATMGGLNAGTQANYYTYTGEPYTDGTHGTPRTTSETRPKNVYVNYIIKY